jgi:hypothetical protein
MNSFNSRRFQIASGEKEFAMTNNIYAFILQPTVPGMYQFKTLKGEKQP